MDKNSLESRKAALEKKKRELAERQKEGHNNAKTGEDKMLQRAQEVLEASNKTEKKVENLEGPSVEPQEEEKTNKDFEVISIPEYLNRHPKSKPKMVEIGVECNLEDNEAILNINSDTNLPDNNKVELNNGESVKEEKEGNNVTTKISAAHMLQKTRKIYSKEEQQRVFEDEKFEKFFRYGTKYIENILFHKVDIMSMVEDEKERKLSEKVTIIPDNTNPQSSFENEEATIIQKISPPTKIDSCLVADVVWNQSIPDLVMVNYCKKAKQEDLYTPYPGKLLIWSANNNMRPEFVLNSKTRITRCQFNPHDPALVYGGLHNGSIATWDLRVNSHPVQMVHPSYDSHFTPIYGLEVTGNRNTYNILSMSSEGKICGWEPSNMNMPLFQQSIPNPKKEKDNALDNGNQTTMSLCLPPGHFSKAFIGLLDGNIAQLNLGASEHSNNNHQYFGASDSLSIHKGPVCSMSYLTNYSGRSNLTQGLILSSSFDWTIKLWGNTSIDRCLHTFTAHDSIVSDVQWNSMHAAKFISCGADGKMLIWNLLKSTTMPVFQHESAGVAITKAQWNVDGRHFAFGDSEGRITIMKQRKSANNYDDESEKHFKEKLNAIISK